ELVCFSSLFLGLRLRTLSCRLGIRQSARLTLGLRVRAAIRGHCTQIEVANRQGGAEHADCQYPPARVRYSNGPGADLRDHLGGRLEALENATERRRVLVGKQQCRQTGDRLRALRLTGPQARVDACEKARTIPVFC